MYKNVLYYETQKITVLIGTHAIFQIKFDLKEKFENYLKNNPEFMCIGIKVDNVLIKTGILAKINNSNVIDYNEMIVEIKVTGISSIIFKDNDYLKSLDYIDIEESQIFKTKYENLTIDLNEQLKYRNYLLNIATLRKWFTFIELQESKIEDIILKTLCVIKIPAKKMVLILNTGEFNELYLISLNSINMLTKLQFIENFNPKKIFSEMKEEKSDDRITFYKEKLDKIDFPDELKEKINKEISKLEKLHPMNSEYNVLSTYLDELFEIPWNVKDKDEITLEQAKIILDKSHYSLNEAKEKVIDYLANLKKYNMKDYVEKKTENKNTSIICLVGPPGVGKTSFANAISKAINRKYVKISLGGISDEAEIRGHRKTYVGAMPGKIIKALKQAKTSNPLILLDEIDKLMIAKGDPSAALLEVLDPEQNKEFVDNYIDYPFDLSDVFFVCTANDPSLIPRALYDRMTIINLKQYSLNEKIDIAEKYIIPELIEETSLNVKGLNKKILKDIISMYTLEAGVRELRTRLSTIFTKIIRKKLENNESVNIEYKIKKSDLFNFLGREKYKKDSIINKEPIIGKVLGLAWTSVGGTTLEVQVVTMKGKGNLILTGTLGDVMKESARVAHSYIRTIIDKYDVDPNFYENTDIHIHFPEGATPKDGPSAGITITTAMLSALLEKKVRSDIAMTGEITIIGNVLPVGGIKEKLLAALNVGITEVIMSEENRDDYNDLSDDIKKQLKIHFVKHYDEIEGYLFK